MVIVYLLNELHYVFFDYIMKMLAKVTAIFVSMADHVFVGSYFQETGIIFLVE